MPDSLPLADALSRISSKTPIGSALKTAEWRDVPLALRERAQFSAGVESVRLLQAIQDRLAGEISQQREALANGKQATFDRSSFIDAIREIGVQEGLTPTDPSKVGTLQDITSIPRLGMIHDMQTAQAAGFATWKLDMNEGALALYPAYRFGLSTAAVPRADWEQRWARAASSVGFEGVARNGEMVALKTSPVWAALSAFGTPWPPFDFGSTRQLEDVDREEAIALGLLGPNDTPEPDGGETGFNAGLEASTRGLGDDAIALLKRQFGDQIRVVGDSVRWVSPQ